MIGFNGGLIGRSNDATAFVSKPGLWTPGEQVVQARKSTWVKPQWIQKWTDSVVYSASAGIISNSSDPYWIDVLPTDAALSYDSSSFANVHDGTLTTQVYWTGDQYANQGNVLRARLDLRSLSVSSIRIFGNDVGLTSYNVQLLDESKTAIAGTSRAIDSNTAAWHVVTVTGAPRYLEFSCTSGGNRRLRLYAIEVNSNILING